MIDWGLLVIRFPGYLTLLRIGQALTLAIEKLPGCQPYSYWATLKT